MYEELNVHALEKHKNFLTGDNTSLSGGTVHGITSPSLGTVVTTDALTINFTGAYQAQLYAFNNGSDSESFQTAEDSETN